MVEEETLRHYLDKHAINKESKAVFIVSTGNVDLIMSRKDLESDIFRYILDMVIGYIEPVDMTNTVLTIRFCLKNSWFQF